MTEIVHGERNIYTSHATRLLPFAAERQDVLRLQLTYVIGLHDSASMVQ